MLRLNFSAGTTIKEAYAHMANDSQFLINDGVCIYYFFLDSSLCMFELSKRKISVRFRLWMIPRAGYWSKTFFFSYNKFETGVIYRARQITNI